MTEQTRLSDLCSICNTNVSKYRCPGCAARTCSLPCYKRHQQWAQCSGKRDPTKFVKKSQLVTPAGIDHDYNFITGIERDIDKAEQGLKASGEGHTTSLPWSHQSQKGQTNYQHLEAAGVKVIRAPKGLSRQKENKSHRSNKKKPGGGYSILWTVEWLDHHQRRLVTETSSTCQIADAQPFAPREQHKGKKRKRNVDAHVATTTSPTTQNASSSTNQDEPIQRELELNVDNKIQVISQEREHSSPRRRSPDPNVQANQEVQTKLAETHHADARHDGSSSESLGHGRYRFYLLKPRTSTSRHVLIHLTPTATLAECLKGRTVLEFPTIYVFPASLEYLAKEFMLEDEYAKVEEGEQKEFDDLIGELDPEILKRLREDEDRKGQGKERGEQVDSSAILDVLKKDFGRAL
ncbi:hypothetical protein EK21DRAFT_112241 [Setomelanomma holmii]|uniref:Box C/D snoRNA protein 1 n=1 Tax=Setomelanomma holmii TaxID=210430 RepID=A0A9P4H9R5_9PLEO|nr:hypothetical protein EK21DRAFT_112241 [Setomelanomma holmii]